eukprot:TRINITY_DN8101_c0_g3_i2.p1 TRINITY_DN8101_c0_g3~~TRINITY_DN8101_c0_g3_i2.p1  ORF type:complete len:323 (-),score=17.95 TRINITY_DN8101_c0_g3_i2:698-1666(-)
MVKYRQLLISNDDGISAPGILALVNGLITLENCSLFVCCPLTERSTQSHALTVSKAVAVTQHQIHGTSKSFAVDGTPGDSVIIAISSQIFGEIGDFDLVISGINRGENLGWHSYYSGTLAAAREAVFRGYSAVAFSLDNLQAKTMENYESAVRLALPIIQVLIGKFAVNGSTPSHSVCNALKGKLLLNVNIPNAPYDEVKGYYLTYQGTSRFVTNLKEVDRTGEGEVVFRAVGYMSQPDASLESDYWAVKEGWVSITPLSLCQGLVLSNEVISIQEEVLGILIPLMQQMCQNIGKQFGIAKVVQSAIQSGGNLDLQQSSSQL